MGIGIIQNYSQYKNICGNYTYHMPAPVCKSKMKDLGDEFVLTEKNDVDYLKIDAGSQYLNRRPVFITMKVPEGCDYNMTIYNRDGNQVGMATDNGDGTKTIKVPCDWSNSSDFVLKIEKADGSVVKPNENYTLTFAQGEMPETAAQALEKARERNGRELQNGEKSLLDSLTGKI